MYVFLNLTEEQESRIQEGYRKYFDQALTDELLQEFYSKCLKGSVKSVITELMQDKEFRAKLVDKIQSLSLNQLENR